MEFSFQANGQFLSVKDGFFQKADGPLTPLAGFTIRPGLVDLHGDAFERHVSPRRGVIKDIAHGLLELDCELAANGITTAVLPQFFSWQGGMRSPWFAKKMVEALAKNAPQLRTEMILQLRIETHMLDEFPAAEALLATGEIPYVVFNNNLPKNLHRQTEMPEGLIRQALRFGAEPMAYFHMLKGLAERGKDVPEAVQALSEKLRERDILLGFHDEDAPEMRACHHDWGLHVSEFPQNLETVKAAKAHGSFVILGAPNIVRGRSHNGAFKAHQAVKAGLCDALVSDYHYPSLRRAALKLAPVIGEDHAWQLVSERPAGCLGLNDRGALQVGKRADLVVLDDDGRVFGTMCRGKWAYLTEELVARLTAPAGGAGS